ncbi:MAG: extracellular solute-binding protein [Spirochaetaceae bacterium]|nr:extracellular solute-binding protein [Spirochaetaceae bacterium]
MEGRAGRMLAILAIALGLVGPAWSQAAERMKITVANYQKGPTDPKGEMLAYFGAKWGVDFKVHNINNDRYHEILNVKLAAGDIPDFLYLARADTLGAYVKQGVLAKLTPELIQENAPDLWNAINAYAPGYMDMGKVNGIQYGIPAVASGNALHIPLVYRGDWMEKVGVAKVPETLAEFESLMYKFAHDDPDGDGKKNTYGLSLDGLNAVFGAFGLVPADRTEIYWMLDGGKIISHSVAPDARLALEILAKWYKDGVIDPEFVTGENHGGYWALSHAFIKGRIGFSAHGNYYHWTTAGAFTNVGKDGSKVPCQAFANGLEVPAANKKAKIAFGNSLKGPTGKQGIKEYNRLMNFITIGKPAEKESGKIEKILQILNESASPDWPTRQTLQAGLVGKHWKVLDAETETGMALPPYDKDVGYASRIGCVMWMAVPFPQKDPSSRWAIDVLHYDRYGIESLVQVSLPKAAKRKDELQKIRDKYYIRIITGALPVAAFDEFVQKYEAAGYAEIRQEAQAYYDAQAK